MNRELKAISLVSIMTGLTLISCLVVFTSSNFSVKAQEDQTLYFQPTRAHALVYWLMNTSVPSGPGMSQQPVLENFASPPLAQEFTYQTITTEIYHEKVPADRGIFTLTITVGFLDTTGSGFYPVNSSETTLVPDSEINSLFIKYDHKLLEDEYLCIRIHITNTLGYPLNIYWGNSTYPSRISYDGTAFYVPEFPSLLIPPLFMIATLLAVTVYRRKPRANLRVPV